MENNHRPIFIVGCERSGTTLLRSMLNAHPRIAIPPQTKFTKKLYKRRLLFGNLAKDKNRDRLVQWFASHHDESTKLTDVDLDPSVVKNGIMNAPPTFGSALSVVFQEYARKFDKTRWGDKRPYYIKYLDQLFTLFPDSQIIHMIRDGRDCIASLKRMPWWRKSVSYSILNWREAIRNGQNARAKLSPDHYIELRYEDLIQNPEKWLKKVCHFLNEEYSPDMLNFQETTKLAIPEYKFAWHSATLQEINTQSIGRWEKELTPSEVALIEAVARHELQTHDYLLCNKHIPIPISKWVEFYRTAVRYQSMRLFTNYVDRIMSSLYRWPISYISDNDLI